MLYRGTKPGVLYKGAYKPGKLYKGTQLVAGYADVSKAAPASWDGTYDDVVGVAAQGRGKQQTYSGKNLLDDAAMRTYSNWRNDLPQTSETDMGFVITDAPGTYTLSWTQPEDGSFPYYFYVFVVGADGGYNYFRLTTVSVIYLSHTITVPAGGYAYVRLASIGNASAFQAAIAKIATIQLETGSTPTAYEPYVGGQPSPSPDYPQPLVAAEGALTASGRTGTTPTTVTLPVLRAIPGADIRDTLAYIGGGQWQVTRRVGVTVVDGEAVKFTAVNQYWNIRPLWTSPGVSDGSVNIFNTMGLGLAGNAGGGFIYTVASWAGTNQFENVETLNARCAELAATGDSLTIWYALATPTTETLALGTLPSYPVHTELAVSGDYPPDVTGIVKVSI